MRSVQIVPIMSLVLAFSGSVVTWLDDGAWVLFFEVCVAMLDFPFGVIYVMALVFDVPE